MRDVLLLLQLIRQLSIRDGGYLDIQPALLDPEGIALVGGLIEDIIEERAPAAMSVGGLATGAIPLAVAASLASRGRRRAFWVRKDPKGRERLPWFAGHPVGPVVLVDDVVRTGRSLLKAAEQVRKQGSFVALAIGVVDMGVGSIPMLTNYQLPYTFLYSKSGCDL
jgi:orotate phosphoribosyltransferase